MRLPGKNAGDLPMRLITPVLVALAVLVGISDLTRALAQIGPHVGDIVVFRAGTKPVTAPDARLIVRRVDGRPCVLDIPVLLQRGGSLVIERHDPAPDRVYRAHWSGARTADSFGDCGAAADVVLTRTDLGMLAVAAGGFGVHRPRAATGS
jgi:hypothetical protein